MDEYNDSLIKNQMMGLFDIPESEYDKSEILSEVTLGMDNLYSKIMKGDDLDSFLELLEYKKRGIDQLPENPDEVKKGVLYHVDEDLIWTPYSDGDTAGILSRYDPGTHEFKRVEIEKRPNKNVSSSMLKDIGGYGVEDSTRRVFKDTGNKFQGLNIYSEVKEP